MDVISLLYFFVFMNILVYVSSALVERWDISLINMHKCLDYVYPTLGVREDNLPSKACTRKQS